MTGAGIGAGFLAGAAFGWLAPTAVGLLLVAWQLAVRRSVPLTPLLVIGGAIALGDLRGVSLPELPEPEGLTDSSTVSGTIREFPRIGGDGQVFFLDLEPDTLESAPGCDGRVRLFVSAPLLPETRLGDHVWVAGSFRPVRMLEAGFARYLGSECAAGSFSAYALEIETRERGWGQHLFAATGWLDRMFLRVAPGDKGVLLSGLVTGRDDAISDERKEAFRNSGTSHITAISGSNLALLVTIATFSGTVLGLRRRRSWQIGLIVVLWVYALLTGLNLPVGRAALVATGTVCAGLIGRRGDALTLLMIGGAAMVAYEPVVLWSLSFQLSMAASVALAVVFDEDWVRSPQGLVSALLTMNIAAQIATLPFAVGAFGQVPLLALPANLIVAPLAQCAFTLAALAGVVAGAGEVISWMTPVGELIAACAAFPAGLILAVVDSVGSINGATLAVHAGTRGIGVLSVACAVVICLLSPDGQRWLTRTVRDGLANRPRRAVLLGSGAAATAVVLAITTIG
jgi:competence protein ComEC